MKLARVPDRRGRETKVAQLSDIDLWFTVPFFAVASALSAADRLFHRFAWLPMRLLTGPLARMGWINAVRLIIVLPVLFVASGLVVAVDGPGGWGDAAVAVVLYLVGGVTISRLSRAMFEFFDPTMPEPRWLSPGEKRLLERHREAVLGLADSCVDRPLDRYMIMQTSLMTMLIAPLFVAALLLPIVSWSGIVTMVLALYARHVYADSTDMLEHIISHTRNGRVFLREEEAGRWRLIERVRRFFVAPLLGFWPDYYYVTHNLHHHVENGAPADFQSFCRYDRDSFFGLTKCMAFISLSSFSGLETLYYIRRPGSGLGASQRRKVLKRFWTGNLVRLVVFGVGVALNPAFMLALLVLRVFVFGHRFFWETAQWHLIQDLSDLRSCERSNVSVFHYCHHKRPRSHLFDLDRVAVVASKLPSQEVTFLLMDTEEGVRPVTPRQLTRRVQGLLLLGEFERAGEYIRSLDGPEQTHAVLEGEGHGRRTSSDVVRRLTRGYFQPSRAAWLERLDRRLSCLIGSAFVRGR